jgi:uncharacterized membrane protein
LKEQRRVCLAEEFCYNFSSPSKVFLTEGDARMTDVSQKVSRIARGALIAAVYAAATIMLRPISYGPAQLRLSEALTVLPVLCADAVPGLFIGCLAANFFGGYGLWDIILGSAATLAAAVMTRRAPNKLLAAAAPVAVNGLVVGSYLSFLTDTPPLLSIGYVAIGEAAACFAVGLPMLAALERTGIFPDRIGAGGKN